jgi:hypothetical protein
MSVSTIAPARPLTVPTSPIEPFVDTGSPSSEPRRRGTSQCMQALARANEVRLARAALKRDVGAGRRIVTDVILHCPWEAESMGLSELLCSQRRWGRARSRKLLASAGLKETKRLGSLTERQRGVLVGALEAKFAS